MSRRFRHADEIWSDFPQLVAGASLVRGVTPAIETSRIVEPLLQLAAERLAGSRESEFVEVRAWRRAFAQMGLRPTQYRCASESLLRRYRKEASLPHLHPLVNLCNAASSAFAIPVAAFDIDLVAGDLEVRYAVGDERYQSFSGAQEHPEVREVVFVDGAGSAHARRWTHRQSARSVVTERTATVLVVVEALHDDGSRSVEGVHGALADLVAELPGGSVHSELLRADAPIFTYAP